MYSRWMFIASSSKICLVAKLVIGQAHPCLTVYIHTVHIPHILQSCKRVHMSGSPYKPLRRVDTLLSVLYSTTKEQPCMLIATHCPQIHWSIGQRIMYNGAAGLGSLCSDSTKHNEGKNTTMFVV